VFFWALHDANYNVIGLVNPFSVARPLVERYEYTPYGQRTVYSRGWLLADVDEDGDVDMDDVIRCEGSSGVNSRCDVTGDGVVDGDDNDLVSNAIGQALLDDGDMHALFYSSRGKDEDGRPPYLTVGLCDIGHQGLLFDKEFGLNRVRTRDYNPVLARWMQGDPIGQRDSINLYEYERSAPLLHLDPSGKWTKIMCCTLCQENLLKHAEDRAAFAAKFALVRLLMRYPFAKGPLQRGGDGTIIRNPDYETQEEEKLRQLVDEIFDDEPSVLSSPVFTPERIKQYRELVLNLHNSLAYTSRDIRKLAVKCITGRDKYCDGPDKGEAYVGLSIYGVYLRHTINICQRFFTREHTDRANTYLHEASHIAANTIDADTDDPTWRVQRRFEVAGRDAWSIGRLAQVDIKYVYDYFVRKIFTPSEPEVAP